jgi:hypothetical protein
MLAVPGTDELADFTGTEEDDLTPFAPQALTQATLLFTIVTGLSSYPSDTDLTQLAKNAIMEMAWDIYNKQLANYAVTQASPFQSESIGSYSYSKGSPAFKAKYNEKTGLFWWDLAIERLASEGNSRVASGSLQVFDPAIQIDANGVTWVLGPADMADQALLYDHADTTIS